MELRRLAQDEEHVRALASAFSTVASSNEKSKDPGRRLDEPLGHSGVPGVQRPHWGTRPAERVVVVYPVISDEQHDLFLPAGGTRTA